MMKRNKKELKLKKEHKLLKLILILFVIVLIIQRAIFSAYVFKSKGNIAEATIDIATDIVGKQDTIFCLFLGISDDLKSNLTDTIILAGYNPNSQKAFMISIPRDTFIGKNTKKVSGYDKINSLYQKGENIIIDEIENICGIEVNNFIVVKNKILIDIVDSIGGVYFNVPINMNYDDKTQNLHIHLKQGEQLLDGKKAEQLVRFRHNNNGTSYPVSYGDNDFGRMKTQREFLKALATQLINIDNVTRIKDIISAIFDNIKTNISLKTIFSYIPYAIEFDTMDLKMDQLPGESKQINDIWFYEYNVNETKEMINEMLEFIEVDKNYK